MRDVVRRGASFAEARPTTPGHLAIVVTNLLEKTASEHSLSIQDRPDHLTKTVTTLVIPMLESLALISTTLPFVSLKETIR